METRTAVATTHHPPVRLGLPVPRLLGPALFSPWASQQVGSGLAAPAMRRKPILP